MANKMGIASNPRTVVTFPEYSRREYNKVATICMDGQGTYEA